jgi:hypothetical protein
MMMVVMDFIESRLANFEAKFVVSFYTILHHYRQISLKPQDAADLSTDYSMLLLTADYQSM